LLNYLEIDHVITVQVSPSMVRVKAYKLLVKLWVFKLLGDGGGCILFHGSRNAFIFVCCLGLSL
jgi:hypothetical protein